MVDVAVPTSSGIPAPDRRGSDRRGPDRGRRSVARRLRPYILLSPLIVLYLGTFVASAVALALTSLRANEVTGVMGDYSGLDQYREYFSRAGTWDIIWRTIRVSVIATLLCLVIGYPAASMMTRLSPRIRRLAFLAVLSPLLMSVLARVFGWWTILGPGPIGDWLGRVFLGRDSGGVLYSETAIVVGMVGIFLPFMMLSILTALRGVDDNLRRAAEGLGASRFTITRTVDIPLAMPGILGGVLLVFSLSIGSYVTATLLGGTRATVVSAQAVEYAINQFNRPLSSVVAVLMLVTTGLVTYMNTSISRRFGLQQTTHREGQ